MFNSLSEHDNVSSDPFAELSRLKRESGFFCVTPRRESALGKGGDPCTAGPGCATCGGDEDDDDDGGSPAPEGCDWLASSSEDSPRSRNALSESNRERSSSGDTGVGMMRARDLGFGDTEPEINGKQ